MIRIFILIGNLFIALAMQALTSGGASVEIEAPQVLTAGESVNVTVHVKKDLVNSFARFQQTLPDGITAIPGFAENCVDFVFEDKKLKVIWLRLPGDETITFNYTLKTDERLKGDLDLTGLFSFIENNKRETVSSLVTRISILPNPNIAPELVVDINDFSRKTIPDYITPVIRKDEFAALPVACIRQTPDFNATKNEYIVNLLVNKNNLEQFAKIEEQIPAGFTAVGVDSKEGIFTFNNQSAKIIWRNLPMEDNFLVTYKLIPDEGMLFNPIVNGDFSYYESDVTHTLTIKESIKDLAYLSAAEKQMMFKAFTDDASTMFLADHQREEKIQEEPKDIKHIEIPEKEEVEGLALVETVEEKPEGQKEVKRAPKEKRNKYGVPKERGVYFRVQIAAGHRPVDIPRYFKRFNISEKVAAEQHDGWLKYSVGSFDEYREARDYRVHLWNTTSIDDAFVSAYNDGGRVTVQEALMISNQKWYR